MVKMHPKKHKNWQKCKRKPDKIIKELRRTCRKQGRSLKERQNGTAHWVGKVSAGPDGEPAGSVLVSRHGEIPKGTWNSIFKKLVALGLALLPVLIFLML